MRQLAEWYLAMNKIQTYKLGLRYKQLKSCFAEAKKQELLQPGSLLVSGWTVLEVREKTRIYLLIHKVLHGKGPTTNSLSCQP